MALLCLVDVSTVDAQTTVASCKEDRIPLSGCGNFYPAPSTPSTLGDEITPTTGRPSGRPGTGAPETPGTSGPSSPSIDKHGSVSDPETGYRGGGPGTNGGGGNGGSTGGTPTTPTTWTVTWVAGIPVLTPAGGTGGPGTPKPAVPGGPGGTGGPHTCVAPPDACQGDGNCPVNQKCTGPNACKCVDCDTNATGAGDACATNADCPPAKKCEHCKCVDTSTPTPTVTPQILTPSSRIQESEQFKSLQLSGSESESLSAGGTSSSRWSSLSAGTGTSQTSTSLGTIAPTGKNAPPARGVPNGTWYHTTNPLTYFLFTPNPGMELIVFDQSGRRFVFEEYSTDNYRLSYEYGMYDTFRRYIYGATGNLSKTQSGLIEVRYDWVGLGSDQQLTISEHICIDSAYSSCTHQADLDRVIIYNASKTLVKKIIGVLSEYLPPPAALGQVVDVSSMVSSRPEKEYSYAGNGLLDQVIYRRDGLSVVLMDIDWEYDAAGGYSRVRSISYPDETVSTFSYSYINPEYQVVVSSNAGRIDTYRFNTDGHVTSYKIRSDRNPRLLAGEAWVEPDELEWRVQYDSGCSCGLPERIDYPSGEYWEGDWDMLEERLITERFVSPDESVASINYEWVDWIDGPMLKKITDPTGITNIEYTWISRTWLGSESPDYKAKQRKVVIPNVILADGTSTTVVDTTTYHIDGRTRAQINNGGVVTKMLYETSSGRNLTERIVRGKNDGTGNPTLTAPSTISSKIERNSSNGWVTGVSVGAYGNEVPIATYTQTKSGRPFTATLDPGDGVPMKTEVYYDWMGHEMLHRQSNLDANGGPPKNSSGVATGRPWIISQRISNPSSSWEIRDVAPVYVPSATNGTNPNQFSLVQSTWNPLTGVMNVSDWMGTVTTVYDGYRMPYTVTKNGKVLSKYYFKPGSKRQSTLAAYNGGYQYNDVTVNYNSGGGIEQIIYPNGWEERYVNDVLGNPITRQWITNGNVKFETRGKYDRLGRSYEMAIVDPQTNDVIPVGGTQYNAHGMVAKQWSQKKNVSYKYDGVGNLLELSAGNNLVNYEYAPNTAVPSKIWNTVSGQRYLNEFTHDNLARKKSVTTRGKDGLAPAVTLTRSYDSLGRTQIEQGPLWTREISLGADGHPWWRRINNRVFSQLRLLNANTKTATIAAADETGAVTTTKVGEYGQVLTFQRPGHGLVTYTYDSALNIDNVTMANGAVADPEYDQFGRISSIAFSKSGTSLVRSFQRDGEDFLSQMSETTSSGTVTNTFTRDRFLRVDSETSTVPGFSSYTTTTNMFDDSGAPDFEGTVFSVSQSGVTWKPNIDPTSGVLTSIGFSLAPSSSFPTTAVEFPDATTLHYPVPDITQSVTFDQYGVLDTILASDGAGAMIDGHSLRRDSSGLATSLVRLNPSNYGFGDKWEYPDPYSNAPLNGKIRVNSVADHDLPYPQVGLAPKGIEERIAVHSPSALRLSHTTTSASGATSVKDFTTDSNNRYASFNGSDLTYDQDGNITYDGTYAYEYDLLNRLVKVKDGATVVESYLYDAMDRLVRTTNGSSGSSTLLKYHGSSVMAEETSSGPSRINLWDPKLPGRLLATWVNSAGSWVGTYSTHSPTSRSASFAADGSKVEEILYSRDGVPIWLDGNGVQQSHSPTGNLVLFNGMRYSPNTGMYLNGNRWLNTELGSHIQRDSILDYKNSNGYTYMDNDTVN